MSKLASESGYRGSVRAAAFLLDVELLGNDEAARRVLTLWRSGTTVRATPDGRWLVILGQPVPVRCEQAPGLALVAADRGLAQPGLPGRPDTVVVSHHGMVRHWSLAELPTVSMAGWINLDELTVHQLTCLDEPPTAARVVDDSARSEPDLRVTAKIRPPSPTARRIALGRTVPLWVSIPGAFLAYVLLDSMFDALVRPDNTLAAITVAAILLLRTAARRVVRGGVAMGPPTARTARDHRAWLARLILRSPVGALIVDRHERYLRQLSKQFQQRRWDDALRGAIGLGAGPKTTTRWTLRLPRRRDSITPTLIRRAGGSYLAYPGGVRNELVSMYRRAAEDLEAAGRIEQAAFVYSDLLDDPGAAVGLLERRDHLRLAAELAEGRGLAPDLVVRLWWRAGRRDRAITVARARGAFAGAVDRLSTVDTAAAVELRREWVDACRQAGNSVAAVEAAWPEETLRPTVAGDIHAGIARGGITAARMTAYLVTGFPASHALDRALDLLAGSDPDQAPERDQFIATLATLSNVDPVGDRRLCTAALRSVVRDGTPPWWGSAQRRALRTLEQRADPLAATDLAVLTSRRRPATGETPELTAPSEPGQLPVFDVANLGRAGLLVALGDLGVRLLGPDGRIRARWGVPTHQLVVADHGGTALLVSMQGGITEAHRLDLDTRRTRRWITFRAHRVLPSFDGGTLTAIDDDGIAFLDTFADHPRVIWRELDSTFSVHAIGRTPQRLTALLTAPAPLPGHPSQVEVWSWELPTLTLRQRFPLPAEASQAAGAAVVGDQIAVLMPTADGNHAIHHYQAGSRHIDQQVPPGTVLLSDTNVYLTQTGTHITVRQPGARPWTMHAAFPTESPIGLRQHAGTISLWDRHGRVVCADPSHPTNTICLRTAL